jgi:hypothetical protein
MSKNEKKSSDSLKLEKFKTNPFLDDFEVITTNKQVRISSADTKNLSLRNHSDGTDTATHVVSYRKVDTEQFIKLFTQNLSALFGLNSTGTKAITFVMWLMRNDHCIGKDQLYIDKEDDRLAFIEWEFAARKKCFASQYHEMNFDRFCAQNTKSEDILKEIAEAWEKRGEKKLSFSETTLSRGLVNLANNQIVAKSTKTNIYFINPNILFNGDRVAFSTVLERKKEQDRDEILRLLDKRL